jgi:hypothetical protein
MAEHAQTGRRAVPARSPEPPRSTGTERSAAAPDRLSAAVNANPAAREAAERGNALSLARSGLAPAPAIQMKSGPVVQMGKSKQEKTKERTEGLKKKKEKKTQQLVDTMVTYQSGNKKVTKDQIREAVVDVQKEKKNLRTGHKTQDSSHKMNQGTKDTRMAVNEKLREKQQEGKDEEDIGLTRKRLPKSGRPTETKEDDDI